MAAPVVTSLEPRSGYPQASAFRAGKVSDDRGEQCATSTVRSFRCPMQTTWLVLNSARDISVFGGRLLSASKSFAIRNETMVLSGRSICRGVSFCVAGLAVSISSWLTASRTGATVSRLSVKLLFLLLVPWAPHFVDISTKIPHRKPQALRKRVPSNPVICEQ